MRAATNLYSNLNTAIQSSEASLENAVNQLSSGKRVTLPSDDPSAFSQETRSLATALKVDRYTRSVEAVTSQNQMADSALSAVVTSLTSAISLATQGGDPTLTGAQRSALADQVQSILQNVVSQANTTSDGAPLFSGTAGVSSAFIADPNQPGSYLYQGNSDSNQAAVGDGFQVQVNVPGDQIFTAADGNVLGSLQQTISALRTGSVGDLSAATNSLSAAVAHIGSIRAIYGAVANQLTDQTTSLSRESVTLSSQQQTLVNTDMATSATALSQAQVAHSAILAVAAKILPESLLNYLH